MIRAYCLLFISFIHLAVFSQDFTLIGNIRSENDEPASFATVVATSTRTGEVYGTHCDEEGHFKLRLQEGTYTFTIHLVGYHDFTTEIKGSDLEVIHRDFLLEENAAEFNDVMVYADKKNLARDVMKNAIEARAKNRGKDFTMTYDGYMKNSIIRTAPDTTVAGKDSTYLALKERDRPKITNQLYLIESLSKVHFSPPSRCHEEILAYQDFKVTRPSEGHSMSMSIEYGEPDIIPQQHEAVNNYQLKSRSGYNEFSLYNRLLDLPSVSEKMILSPIGAGAMLSYQFDLDEIDIIDSTRVYKIKVTPLFKSEPLFSGIVHIRSDDWALIYADLRLNDEALIFYDNFHLVQYYDQLLSGQYTLADQSLDYSIKEGHAQINADIDILHSNRTLDSLFKFDQESVIYTEDAYDQDSAYWDEHRFLALTENELKYVSRQDSLQALYGSEEYYHKVDSTYNQLKFMDFILYGVGYRNREKNYEFFLNPLIMQLNPVGIGGYRHRLGGSFQKEFPNAYLLETDGMIDYGFRNEDVRGKVGLGLTYVPKKFVRTFIRVGDYYDMINTYASLGSLFSRSNYVRTQTISIAQRMELVNGLFAEVTFDYSDQKPINNMEGDKWSQRLFGDVNTPISFDRYTKSEIRLDLKYKIGQKYEIRKNKKILLGSRYPDITMTYRKGIPGLLRSEVNFDYIELKAKNETELGRLGNMEWSVMAGTFFNKTNLRLLEHRYFRGSDPIFFSDPLLSFQLLGPTLSTPNTYLRGNYFHHFNGIVLNKIPLIRKLKLTEAAGCAFLSIPSQDFHHAEFYAGIERTFRIREEIFRLGIYACTADSSWNKARIEFKIGLNFFDAFHKKWQY